MKRKEVELMLGQLDDEAREFQDQLRRLEAEDTMKKNEIEFTLRHLDFEVGNLQQQIRRLEEIIDGLVYKLGYEIEDGPSVIRTNVSYSGGRAPGEAKHG